VLSIFSYLNVAIACINFSLILGDKFKYDYPEIIILAGYGAKMKIKRELFLLISFLFAPILLPNVYAESQNSLSGAAETIEELFGFIPNIITLEKLMGEDAAAMFWARFLLWVLLFAVFYYGAGFAFKAGDKANPRIAGTVAFVFATISALLIPEKIIMGIFRSYGLLSAIIIWFVPVLAGFFLVSKLKPKPVKAVIYLGMIFVLVSIDDSITSKFATDLANNMWYPFFKLVLAVVIIAFLWNLLFAGIEGWNAEVHGGGGGSGGSGGGGGGNQPGRNPPGNNPPGQNPPRNNPPNQPPGNNPPGNNPPGQNPPDPNRPDPNHPGPPDHDDDDEIITDKKEILDEIKIWRWLKKLEDKNHLGHLIGGCENRDCISSVETIINTITENIGLLEHLESRELKLAEKSASDVLAEQGMSEKKMSNHWDKEVSLKKVLESEKEIKVFTHFEKTFSEIKTAVNKAIELIKTQGPIKDKGAYQKNVSDPLIGARVKTLFAMRLVELLIRMNYEEIRIKKGIFKENVLPSPKK